MLTSLGHRRDLASDNLPRTLSGVGWELSSEVVGAEWQRPRRRRTRMHDRQKISS
jgi:hypothetical protein